MAKQAGKLVDDLDGSTGEDVRTIDFSFDGAGYQIDLSEANVDRMSDVLEEFIEAARLSESTLAELKANAQGESRRRLERAIKENEGYKARRPRWRGERRKGDCGPVDRW